MRKLIPLEWVEDPINPERYYAHTWFGTYWCGKSDNELYGWHSFASPKVEKSSSLKEVKEKAWQHYQSVVDCLYE
jgi:hypothetical protein